jgi:osomolarity two-component system response regulator SKN7
MAALPRELNPLGPSGSGASGMPGMDSLALSSTALLPAPAMGADALGKINPLAGMGLSDAEYAGMLAGMVAGEAFGMQDNSTHALGVAAGTILLMSGGGGDKRAREGEDGREAKRSRFEEVV